MLGGVEVLGGMAILGGIATADVPTLQAHPQMHPRIAGFKAIFTDVLCRVFDFDLVQMSAFGSHRVLDAPGNGVSPAEAGSKMS